LEDTAVNEIMKQRKKYISGLVSEKRRMRIVWNSAPIPDFEMLANAAKENLGIPTEMVGFILAKEMGVEDLRETFMKRQEMNDQAIESFLKRKNLRVTSKTTGMDKDVKEGKSSENKAKSKPKSDEGGSSTRKRKSSDSKNDSSSKDKEPKKKKPSTKKKGPKD